MFWKLYEPKPNGSLAAQLFLKILNVRLSASTLLEEVENHPDYPSLLSISDVFSKYNVENLTASFEPDQIMHIPPPYITQLKGNSNAIDYFTVVSDITGDELRFFDPEKQKWRWTQANDFAKRSSGIILLAEAREDAGESNYRQKRIEERMARIGSFTLAGLIIAVLILSIGNSLAVYGFDAILPVVFFTATITGVFLGILLIWYEIDRHNPVIQQICKSTNRVNCHAVLESNAAKIGGVSWSIIGTSYFLGTSILMLLQGITDEITLVVVGLLSTLASPFIFFSIYYQWRIAKQWCLLCLLVQGVLLLQVFIALKGEWIQNHSSILLEQKSFWVVTLSYIFPFLVLILWLPLLKNIKYNKIQKRELNRLKYDPIVFDALLKKQKSIHDSSAGMGLTIGNPAAKNKILKVCNPYCGPCAKAHTPIEDILNSNPDIQLQMIFTASAEETDYKRQPVRHLLSIAANNDEDILIQALDAWYLAKEKNYEHFALKYPVQDDLSLYDRKIAAMRDWCDSIHISHTPTIFVNSYELPRIYSIHDLKKFFIT